MAEAQERLAAALSDRYRIERELGAGGEGTPQPELRLLPELSQPLLRLAVGGIAHQRLAVGLDG